MTPSEEEVRAYLTDMAYQNEILSRAEAYRHAAAIFRAALALLDAGRKDRERVDWIEAQDRAVEIGPWEWSPVYDTISLRAAIDQARGA